MTVKAKMAFDAQGSATESVRFFEYYHHPYGAATDSTSIIIL